MENYSLDTLTEQDGQLFHQLWDNFLFYVADQYGWKRVAVEREITSQQFFSNCAQIYYHDRSYMDRYLETKAKDFSEEHKHFLEDWKNALYGKYIVLELQRRGAVFISINDEKVYLVKGLVSPWDEIFYGWKMPVVVECAIFNFGGVVISDGLFANVMRLTDREAINRYEQLYQDALKNKTLIKRFKRQ